MASLKLLSQLGSGPATEGKRRKERKGERWAPADSQCNYRRTNSRSSGGSNAKGGRQRSAHGAPETLCLSFGHQAQFGVVLGHQSALARRIQISLINMRRRKKRRGYQV